MEEKTPKLYTISNKWTSCILVNNINSQKKKNKSKYIFNTTLTIYLYFKDKKDCQKKVLNSVVGYSLQWWRHSSSETILYGRIGQMSKFIVIFGAGVFTVGEGEKIWNRRRQWRTGVGLKLVTNINLWLKYTYIHTYIHISPSSCLMKEWHLSSNDTLVAGNKTSAQT